MPVQLFSDPIQYIRWHAGEPDDPIIPSTFHRLYIIWERCILKPRAPRLPSPLAWHDFENLAMQAEHHLPSAGAASAEQAPGCAHDDPQQQACDPELLELLPSLNLTSADFCDLSSPVWGAEDALTDARTAARAQVLTELLPEAMHAAVSWPNPADRHSNVRLASFSPAPMMQSPACAAPDSTPQPMLGASPAAAQVQQRQRIIIPAQRSRPQGIAAAPSAVQLSSVPERQHLSWQASLAGEACQWEAIVIDPHSMHEHGIIDFLART